ncbi:MULTISPECIES: hypothetical protein [Micromonospora]|uniref:Uncharacterized protein n=1 Tax=Micromonospora yangpuensis TaxID=683228 RepID=A0A1C6UNY3_9ACTN|nr:hypothetical protein [Micromonospora yangpuensis]GGM09124.1 hypothetical protein GCM10012279_28970 [Micromonospora yangpuensis]SCL55633.1 hypothetical protein GA0070617_3013 [Micromonospora yangpuensis]
MRRTATLRIFALAATITGFVAFGAATAQAGETGTSGPGGTAVVVTPTPTPSASTDNHPWD